ncbi:MAG: hypothetical protein R3Y09_10720 [Clostridia bacterium]
MIEIKNSNGKRICDISDDKKAIVIKNKNCETVIIVNEKGKLEVKK